MELAFFILFFIYAYFLLVLASAIKTPVHNNEQAPFVSVIIAARNEEKQVGDCIKAVLAQTYPAELFEIVIVDDQSTDNTLEVINSFASIEERISVLHHTAPKWKSSKKSALNMGIEHAKGEILLFTDADCLPPSTWIQNMVNEFDESTGLVAGFSPLFTDGKPIWSHVLFIDSLAAAFVSAATIFRGSGVTCAGRNLAYRKQAFVDVGGFENCPDTLSGDDDFILKAISDHPNWEVSYNLRPDSMVPSHGPKSVDKFLRMKTRHISAGHDFDPVAQTGFVVYHILNVLLWVSIFTLNFYFILLKMIIDFSLLGKLSHQFNKKLKITPFLVWQIFYPFYHGVSFVSGLFSNPTWKEPRD